MFASKAIVYSLIIELIQHYFGHMEKYVTKPNILTQLSQLTYFYYI